MKPVIEVEGLSKRYYRGRAGNSNSTLREALMNVFTAGRGRPEGQAPSQSSEFWALREIGFSVREGEVVGVIGSNGAGKSTLLKVLSRITEPTAGTVTLRGRMASLLEVGTGFHPELTGRENIFLNGTILGMSRQEIARKFDEIVAFAEIGDFLDTPVKHYSSGMYVRLAFAVSANLAPDILVVDEVLAVGDVSFQKKCLGKMSEVSSQGRTVLFVSHNMAAVENLCQRGIVLRQGRLVFDGAAKDAIQSYLSGISAGASGVTHRINLQGPGQRQRHYTEILREMQLLDGSGTPLTAPLSMGQPMQLAIDAHFARPVRDVEIGVGFDSIFGQRLVTYTTALDANWPGGNFTGAHRFLCRIPELPLTAGEYRLKVFARTSGVVLDAVENACQLQVVESDMFGTGNQPYGAFAGRSSWRLAVPEDADHLELLNG
ncbi:MAG: ABC transporter ATP-binding protein [Acidobacteriota bacterium]|nr:ABC transporter ATP-binding protein [Acidobacteriota bacterium]